MENNPMMSGVQEHRITVNNQVLILAIGNVPVMPSLNKLIKLGNSLQAKHIELESELVDICKEEESQIAELETTVRAREGEVLTNEELFEMKRLMGKLTVLEKVVDQKPVKYRLEKMIPLVHEGFKGLLGIMCPSSTITDEVVDGLTFGDIASMAEKFYKVNKLDLIPKKLIPQSLKDMALKLVSGEM